MRRRLLIAASLSVTALLAGCASTGGATLPDLTGWETRKAVLAETDEWEFAGRIGAFAETVEPGEWIMHGTWDHEMWGGELPRRDWIDEVTPDHPVWVSRLDGHMALANSLALKLAGVDADTPDVDGGEIVPVQRQPLEDERR